MSKVQRRQTKNHFDDKGEVATVIVVADRGIIPGNDFAINFCRDSNVLSSRQAENVLNVRKLETVTKTG